MSRITPHLKSAPLALVLLWAAMPATLLSQAGASQTAQLPVAPAPNPEVLKAVAGSDIPAATAGSLSLSLDEAIARGLEHNLQIVLGRQNERSVHGQVLSVANNLLPNLSAVANTSAREIDLAAMGFKPSSLAALGFRGHFSEIVKVNTTAAQLNLSQQLFNLPAYYLYRAAQRDEVAANMQTLLARGNIALAVGTQYLKAVADSARIDDARSLLQADQAELQQATALHDAGVAVNLDVLRAKVQFQAQQQVVISDENAFAKDKIQLNRLIGLPAGQELTLADTAPYSEYAELPLDEAMKVAQVHRKDLLGLQAQLEVADRTRKAVKFERLPALTFGGYYGVLGITNGLYHGVFAAQGNLSVPIFEEAQLRGEREVAEAQVTALRQQIASLNVSIEQQIRASMLDVNAASELVKVARSNVDLATQELQQANDRFVAGVSDNLPVVQAQAGLSAAQSRFVDTLFQYNQAKLALARNTGVVETQYKTYLGR